MSVKHVQEYYLKVAKDYQDMLETLTELEKNITDSSTKTALNNINVIKQQVMQLKENYLRISYIMFLLNMPNNPKKKNRYEKREIKRLNAIPNNHTLDGVMEENKKILTNLQNLINN